MSRAGRALLVGVWPWFRLGASGFPAGLQQILAGDAGDAFFGVCACIILVLFKMFVSCRLRIMEKIGRRIGSDFSI